MVILFHADQEAGDIIHIAPAEMYNEKWLNLNGVLSRCPWMCAIPVYDYGELKVLIFGLVEDGRLQVKING